MKNGLLIMLSGLAMFALKTNAQAPLNEFDCTAKLSNDTLTIENSSIARSYKWNGGNLVTLSLTDKQSHQTWKTESTQPDFYLPGETQTATQGECLVSRQPATPIEPAHLEVTVTYSLQQLQVKRVFRIYPACPVIACDLYLKGTSNSQWLKPAASLADLVNLEKVTGSNGGADNPVIENIALPGHHWQLNAVEFLDITDRNNTLVYETKALSYRSNAYRGNLLIAKDNVSDNGVFLLKEAPTSNVQLAYPGADFLTAFGTLKITGAGILPSDLQPTEWTRAYGFVTGVFSGDERAACMALRTYQKCLRIHEPHRDDMILLNTWGDRAQDSRVREKFALQELEAGARLGITHFQLDDGWQSGRSANSAYAGGTLTNIWQNPRYWQPDPGKFPNGLQPVIDKGKQLGIEICLWFNPSKDSSNKDWEKDAAAVTGLYKKYGIRTFKIDGVNLPDKKAETNFRNFLDNVSRATNDSVVFNLDVTAGRRGGYYFFNKYGNLFLENRYTDWQNYYPYTTLRNLWMLSRYVPAENLQIEFLNKWRNTEKYAGDPFAPSGYSFDYIFAITMPAQPLAWFEASGLPDEAFTTLAPVIKKYRTLQADFHKGYIFPIGQEPSGKSWTGFQSMQSGSGYFLVFREDTGNRKESIQTWLQQGTSVTCTPILGKGKHFTATAGANGTIDFELPEKNSYALYHYVVSR